jgi:hypothetical protein
MAGIDPAIHRSRLQARKNYRRAEARLIAAAASRAAMTAIN